ncbi:hypothetical protein pipiens_006469 [Culex pipiens pipiens]|uniref:Carboxylic ester hydrolase n=1 Tax=Culex pipiens pipiens TaxID=38569 RepID=A0ABD1DQA7_CULPP
MSCALDDVVLCLPAGRIQGRTNQLPNGKEYYSFKGIPYAKPPVGELRFKPPVPVDRFCDAEDDDLLVCSYERNSCPALMQLPPTTVSIGEDCLHANVATPVHPSDVDQQPPLPVMVWIHGGAFNLGNGDSSLYCPQYLVQQGVIVVTFNYRLGPIGFLQLPSAGIHGNMGLKDQRLLLRWVSENISFFGGDPTNVTLFGESAGSASVHLHYLTEESRKYFHKAICQSGTAFNVWVEQKECETKARTLAKNLGCTGDSDEEVYETLMSASVFDLFAKSEGCMAMNDILAMRMFPFTPTVESADSEEPFITENYTNILHRPDLTSIPLIIGFNSNESVTFLPLLQPAMKMFSQDPRAFVPAQLTVPAEELASVGAEIKRFYYGDDTAHCLTGFLDYVSDIWFIIPSFVASELQARFQQSASQFCYYFDFDCELNYLKANPQDAHQLEGVAHGDDISYLFKRNVSEAMIEDGSRADEYRAITVQLWTNFAKFGHPTPEPSEVGFEWQPLEPIDCDQEEFVLKALHLTDPIRMIEQPFEKRIQFWKKLFARFGDNYLHLESNK